jgi:hypothetical protein
MEGDGHHESRSVSAVGGGGLAAKGAIRRVEGTSGPYRGAASGLHSGHVGSGSRRWKSRDSRERTHVRDKVEKKNKSFFSLTNDICG